MVLLLLLQVPPVVASDRLVMVPVHTEVAPLIADTTGMSCTFSVKVCVVLHIKALVTVYDIVAVPLPIPVTTPVAGFTMATVPSLLLHVPVKVRSARVVTVPVQMSDAPVIAATVGTGFTFTPAVAIEPQPNALLITYDIVAAPALTPVTVPLASTVAMPLLLLLHVPPADASDRVIADPAHTVVVAALMLPAVADG